MTKKDSFFFRGMLKPYTCSRNGLLYTKMTYRITVFFTCQTYFVNPFVYSNPSFSLSTHRSLSLCLNETLTLLGERGTSSLSHLCHLSPTLYTSDTMDPLQAVHLYPLSSNPLVWVSDPLSLPGLYVQTFNSKSITSTLRTVTLISLIVPFGEHSVPVSLYTLLSPPSGSPSLLTLLPRSVLWSPHLPSGTSSVIGNSNLRSPQLILYRLSIVT